MSYPTQFKFQKPVNYLKISIVMKCETAYCVINDSNSICVHFVNFVCTLCALRVYFVCSIYAIISLPVDQSKVISCDGCDESI